MCVILFDNLSIRKNFYLSNFSALFFADFFCNKFLAFQLVFFWLEFLQKFYIFKKIFILSNQIVTSTMYHSCGNNFQWFLDRGDALIWSLLAVIIQNKRSLWQMRGVPCADAICVVIFILQLIVLNTF